MTRQELLNKLAKAEYKNTVYTVPQITSALSSASQADKDTLAAAVNTSDKTAIATIVLSIIHAKRNEDALAAVNAKIQNDKIDIDDVAAVLGTAQ